MASAGDTRGLSAEREAPRPEPCRGEVETGKTAGGGGSGGGGGDQHAPEAKGVFGEAAGGATSAIGRRTTGSCVGCYRVGFRV